MDSEEVLAEIAKIEVDTLEGTRQWLADHPGWTVEDLWEHLEEWHEEHIEGALLSAAHILGPAWTEERVGETLAIIAHEAEHIQRSADLNRQATMMADAMTAT